MGDFIKFIAGFFREGTPESSSRLIAFVVGLNCCALMWYSAINAKSLDTLILGALGIVLTAKFANKTKE